MQVESGDLLELSGVEAAGELLAANVNYQDHLRALMKRVYDAQQRTKQLQTVLKGVEDQVATAPARTIHSDGMKTPNLPWFKDLHKRDLPPNPEGRARDRYLNTIRQRPWSFNERDHLRNEIYDFMKRHLIERDIAAGRHITAQAYPIDTVLAQPVELDWGQIAFMIPNRSATDCRIRWLEHDQPALSRDKPWSIVEGNNLLELVKKYDKSNWAQIAHELGTGRTAADCVRHYRDSTFTQHEFSQADDDKLKQLVQEHSMDWQKIARLMNLSASQVSYRYLHSLIPTKTKGQFSEIEDAMLRASVNQNGTKSWTKVAKQVPGRTGSQCRDRWCDYLDPNLKLANQWEKWEDDLILKMKDQEGKNWGEIAAALGEGRSDLHVTKRHKMLRKAIGRGGENFATVARENKRKAEAAAREEERRQARAERGIVELGTGEARPEGEGVEVGQVWYPLDLLQRIEEGELPELPELPGWWGVPGAEVEGQGEGEGAAVVTGAVADGPGPKKKARRVKAPTVSAG